MKFHNVSLNSYPILLHHHGSRRWNKIGRQMSKDYFRHMDAEGIPGHKMGDNLTIITWDTREDTKTHFECGLEKQGTFPVLKLAQGKEYCQELKVQELCNALDTGLVTTEYVLCCDGYDVVMMDSPMEIVKRFEEQFDCDALFNAEGWNHPPKDCPQDLTDFQHSAVPADNPYQFLNSGVMIAKTAFLKSIVSDLRNTKPYDRQDDQALWKMIYQKHYPRIQTDYLCKIFQSTAWSKKLEKNYPGMSEWEWV